MPLRVILCDRRPDVVEAWKAQFDESPEVEVRQGDVFESGAEALVLPGNSFGFLDRGLELQVSERFGWGVQDRLREAIRSRFHGEVLVGQALFQPLDPPFRHLLYAPIARTPRKLLETIHAFLAARGAFLALSAPGAPEVSSVVFPGLGTGNAGLHPLISARQLRYAYEMFAGKRGPGDKNLTQLARRERKLQAMPGAAEE